MSRYRRAHTPGACYFFTLVTYRRQRFLCDDDVRLALRESIAATHMDYVHYNPVKHALCRYPTEWPYTSLHRLIRAGVYPRQWGEDEPIVFPSGLELWEI